MAPAIKIRYNAPVILSFVLLSLMALGLARLTNGQSNTLLFSVYPSSWNNPFTYLRLLTHVLGHVDWAHYSSNIMLLLLIGPLLEEKYGSLQTAIVILVTAIATGLSHVFFFQSALMGASGVVFAFIILTSMTGREKGGIPLTFLVVTAVYLGGEIYQMFAVSDNISQITHVIGGVVGALSGSFMRPKAIKIPMKTASQSPTIPANPPLYPDPEDKPWKQSLTEEGSKKIGDNETKNDPIKTEPW